MRELLTLLRRLAGAALAAASMGLHTPVAAAGMDGGAHATPKQDQNCVDLPAGSCAGMAACAERPPVAAQATRAPQPAAQDAAPDPSSAGAACGAARMPVARIARYGPPAYLEFHSLLL